MSLRQRAYRQLFARADETGRLSFTNRFMVFVILSAVAVTILSTEAAFRHTNADLLIGI